MARTSGGSRKGGGDVRPPKQTKKKEREREREREIAKERERGSSIPLLSISAFIHSFAC